MRRVSNWLRSPLHNSCTGPEAQGPCPSPNCSCNTTSNTLARSLSCRFEGSHRTNKTLIAAVTPTLQGIKDEMALSSSHSSSRVRPYTYAAALTLLQDPAYLAATATILPIGAQHKSSPGCAGKDVDAVFPTSAAISRSATPCGSAQGLDPLSSQPDPRISRATHEQPDLNNDEIRRQLRAADRMNTTVVPRWRRHWLA
jgi:hypothetical protein